MASTKRVFIGRTLTYDPDSAAEDWSDYVKSVRIEVARAEHDTSVDATTTDQMQKGTHNHKVSITFVFPADDALLRAKLLAAYNADADVRFYSKQAAGAIAPGNLEYRFDAVVSNPGPIGGDRNAVDEQQVTWPVNALAINDGTTVTPLGDALP
jgi:hypothetical protein